MSRRVLWVGADAYPLQNIARARRFEIVPRRGYAVRAFLKAEILVVVLGAVALAITENIGDSSSPSGLATFAALVVLALFVLNIVKLVRRLRRPILHQLVIETSSSSDTAVVSTDVKEVNHLIGLIMEAIDNPQAEFQLQVENVHIGDQINQFGDNNTGKKVNW
ncbi:DUF6232 family protein [Kitasatospora sp. NPDC088351]|uniref:DUF6232 family protein n=1 Tax=unclassified Kitasatospora TaxID=2633591 RepID=UPI003436C186